MGWTRARHSGSRVVSGARAVSADSVLVRTPPPVDATVVYGDDPNQVVDLRLPAGDGPFPATINIHGGFWRAQYDRSHAGHFCAAFTAAGVLTFNIEYRRIGNGGGWPNTFLDVHAAASKAFAVAGEYKVDPARVVVTGHSAGGHLALWLAGCGKVAAESEIARPSLPLRAAVSLAGAVDLRETWTRFLGGGVVKELLGGTPDEVTDRYDAASPIELLPLGVRQLLIHGENDEIVPPALSRDYVEKAKRTGDVAELLQLSGTEHFAVIDPESSAWPRIQRAVLALFEQGTPVSR